MPKRRESAPPVVVKAPELVAPEGYRSGWSALSEYLHDKPARAVLFLAVFSAWILACTCGHVYWTVNSTGAYSMAWRQLPDDQLNAGLIPVLAASVFLNIVAVHCMPVTIELASMLVLHWLVPLPAVLYELVPPALGIAAWAYAMVAAATYIVKRIT